MKPRNQLLYVICLATLSMSMILGAQTMPLIHFGPSPSQDVSFAQFDPAISPVFNKIFASSPKHAAVQRVSFVVTNNSPKSIIGLAFKYRIIDSDRQLSPYTLRTHSYLSSTLDALTRPGEQMLVSPDSFISESVARPSRGIAGTLPRSKTIELFSNVAEIYVDIDAVIFEDGEVVGPNDLQLVQTMQHFKAAADVVQKEIDMAITAQQDPITSLRRLQAAPRSARDPIGKELSRLLGQLLSNQNLESSHSYIEKLRSQPAFFRKDGKSL